MEKRKLAEGDEVIFLLNNKTLMEKVKVESIDKKNGFAILANKVRVSRILNAEGYYPRTDGREGFILPITEHSEMAFQAYRAMYSIHRNLEFIIDKMKNLQWDRDADLLIELDKKLSKITTKCFEK